MEHLEHLAAFTCGSLLVLAAFAVVYVIRSIMKIKVLTNELDLFKLDSEDQYDDLLDRIQAADLRIDQEIDRTDDIADKQRDLLSEAVDQITMHFENVEEQIDNCRSKKKK